MKYLATYLRIWLIIKKKQALNYVFKTNTDYTRFAIVCAPRTGSNWLHTLLNSSPQIISYGEILRRKLEKTTRLFADINNLVFFAHPKAIKAVGLKLFYQYQNDLSHKKAFQDTIEDKKINIIHLVRKDIVAQYVSLKRAEKNQIWSQAHTSDNTQPVTIDLDEFKAYKEYLIDAYDRVKKDFQGHNMIEVYYEDLAKHPDDQLMFIQQFLNVKPRKLVSLLKKQSVGVLQNQITNWQEVKEHI